MKLVHLIPGAGNTFYCENCLRDHGLAKALRELGHDALMVPLYLPIMTDTEGPTSPTPVFFGGINVFLQQKLALFRKTPQWVDRLLDHPRLLRWAAGMQGMTRAQDLAETTLSMLQGRDGRQAKELDKLIAWLQSDLKPDAVHLSNALLLGMAPTLKEALDVPVICTLQDEDIFIDPLPEPYRQEVWDLMARQAQHVDAFVAVSDYYDGFMAQKLAIPGHKRHRVHNGIDWDGHGQRPGGPDAPVIGFLERQCPDKGLHTLVEAFIRLKGTGNHPALRLRVAGGQTAEDTRYVRRLQRNLRKAGLERDVDWLPNPSSREKREFLHGLTLLSVPARHAEAFGIYILDALAEGVPVVLPDHGAFAEILAHTGGGHLYAPHDAQTLADQLDRLLADPGKLDALGRSGIQAVRDRFTTRHMAQGFDAVLRRVKPD